MRRTGWIWIATINRILILLVLLFIAREVSRTNVLLWLQYTVLDPTYENYEIETVERWNNERLDP